MARNKDYRRGPAEQAPAELPPVELPADADAELPPVELPADADGTLPPPEAPAAGAEAEAGAPRKYRYRVANAFVQVTGEAVGTSPEQVAAAVTSWLTAGLEITEG